MPTRDERLLGGGELLRRHGLLLELVIPRGSLPALGCEALRLGVTTFPLRPAVQPRPQLFAELPSRGGAVVRLESHRSCAQLGQRRRRGTLGVAGPDRREVTLAYAKQEHHSVSLERRVQRQHLAEQTTERGLGSGGLGKVYAALLEGQGPGLDQGACGVDTTDHHLEGGRPEDARVDVRGALHHLIDTSRGAEAKYLAT